MERRNINSDWQAAISEALVRRRIFFLFVAAAISLCCFLGLAKVTVDNDYRTFIGDDNDYLEMSDWLSDRQTDERESVAIVYEPGDGDLFSQRSLLSYTYIARSAGQLPYVDAAQSLFDIEKLVAVTADDPTSRLEYFAAPFLFGLDTFSNVGRQRLREEALNTPAIRARFIGSDGRTALITLFLQFEEEKPRREQLAALFDSIEGLQATLREENPTDNIHLAGTAIFDYSALEVLRGDLRRILPLALVLICIAFFAIFRSIRFVACSLVIVVVPVIATAGAAALAGLEFSNLSISGLLLVGTLAVADVMHISNTYFKSFYLTGDPQKSVFEALKSNIRVIAATTITTSVGQVALLFSSAEPIQVMGIIVIIGSWLALLLAVLILPAVLYTIRPKRAHTINRMSSKLAAVARIGFRYPAQTLSVSILLIVFCLYSVSTSTITDSLTGWFAEGTEFHTSMSILDSQYFGGDTINIAVEAKSQDLLAARAHPRPSPIVNHYRQLKTDLEIELGSGKWFDPISSAHSTKAMLDNANASIYVQDAATVGQLDKFSTESVAGSGLMTKFQPGKRDYSLWYYDGDESSSFSVLDKARRLESLLDKERNERDVKIGGVGLALAQLSVENFDSVLYGSFLTMAIIIAFMFLILPTCRLAISSIGPNLAPLIIAFGLWAAVFGHFNLAAITVFSVALGIIVDDTLHILMKYHEKLELNSDRESAFSQAIDACGVGVMATTIVIGIGFLLLGTSGFLLTAQKTQLAAVAVFSAFLFDVLVLPAILALNGPRNGV